MVVAYSLKGGGGLSLKTDANLAMSHFSSKTLRQTCQCAQQRDSDSLQTRLSDASQSDTEAEGGREGLTGSGRVAAAEATAAASTLTSCMSLGAEAGTR